MAGCSWVDSAESGSDPPWASAICCPEHIACCKLLCRFFEFSGRSKLGLSPDRGDDPALLGSIQIQVAATQSEPHEKNISVLSLQE